MSERDDFLRDRLRHAPPVAPGAHPQSGQPHPSHPPQQHQPQQLQPVRQHTPPVPSPLRPPPRPPGMPQRDRWSDIDIASISAPRGRPVPGRGWRQLVYKATFGLVNPGPSASERREAEFESIIRSTLHGNYKVGVLGKGGVGKTTVAACVGSIFAELRRQDRVVAIDADTAFGRLGSRIDPRTSGSYWELTADKNIQSFADVSARVGSNSAGLYVLAGEPPAGPRRVLDPAIYREATLRLDRHFTISIIDCGSTMDAPVTQEALSDLDALIVVSSPWADGASAAAQTMEWLSAHGRSDLLRRSILVLNDSDGHADKRTRSVLAHQFLDRGQLVVEVPFDPHLRPGGVIDVSREMTPAARRKFLEIAAAVAGFFASQPDSVRERRAR
ncbi:MinD/ParA family ATP-binding protein [Mycobacterium shimoidei]|uniref:MinD/ParA family ATP-binding protein n=1 Tax=Mycobacterium shimoidei TaxID=29313 RepID=UPI00084954D5|nr:MinD/ParA family protein [Mycobacterium shimoidei]MCV7258875.1 MinD/ParA family protein [Mycobacterium shimoidei]ODR15238.1 ATPase [Mycobacterium shimoidei]ORW79820.1 ATPase [Mycobacterium shimoidei]